MNEEHDGKRRSTVKEYLFAFALIITLPLSATTRAVAQVGESPAQIASHSARVMVASDTMLGYGVLPKIYNYSGLLKNPKVQKEIGITDEQKVKLAKLKPKIDEEEKKLNDLMRSYLQQREDAQTDEERAAIPVFGSAEIRDKLRDMEERLMKPIFDRTQQRRLKELMYQAEGPRFFEREEAKEQLMLTTEQIENLKEVSKRATETYRKKGQFSVRMDTVKLDQPNSEGTLAYLKTIEVLRKDAAQVRVEVNKSMMNCLLNNQRAKYHSMIGKPFDFTSDATPDAWLKKITPITTDEKNKDSNQ